MKDANTAASASASLKDETTLTPHQNFACADSAASSLRNLFENPVLSDVEIEGTDGTRLSAHRNILASRSEYFLQLFAGDFSEAKSPVVSLGFDGDVLKAVLEYCYTDEITFTCNKTEEDSEDSKVRLAMDVASAADYFAIPKLCDMVIDWAAGQMEKNPALAWVFLVAAETSSQADIWVTCACQVMAAHPSEACLSLGEESLSRVNLKTIERIVSYEKMSGKESDVFSLVASWAGAADSKRRKADAASLVARHVHLDKMSASDLAAIAAPSGLVTTNQLCDSYKSLATRAETAGFGPVSEMRRAYWETTKSTFFQDTTSDSITELLECEPMQTGKHRWSIEVALCSTYTCLGLACSAGGIDRKYWLGGHQHCWAWRTNGFTYHAGSEVKPHGELLGFKPG